MRVFAVSGMDRGLVESFTDLGHVVTEDDWEVAYTEMPDEALEYSASFPTIFHPVRRLRAADVAGAVRESGGLVLNHGAPIQDIETPTVMLGRDPNIWNGWTGERHATLYVKDAHDTAEREVQEIYLGCSVGLNASVWEDDTSAPPADTLLEAMRQHRAFFDLGPSGRYYSASVVEAAMVGMPLILPDHKSSAAHPDVAYMVRDLLPDCALTVPGTERVAEWGRFTGSAPYIHRWSSENVLVETPIMRRLLGEASQATRDWACAQFSLSMSTDQLSSALSTWEHGQ